MHIDRMRYILYNQFRVEQSKRRMGEMLDINEETERNRLIEIMTEELPILRARMRISQGDLARSIGISRQTYSLIETRKQKMTWVTYMALIGFFVGNSKTKKHLSDLGLYTELI